MAQPAVDAVQTVATLYQRGIGQCTLLRRKRRLRIAAALTSGATGSLASRTSLSAARRRL